MTPIIEVKNLSVIYNLGRSNEFAALKDINFQIYPGEYIILYGPSGCGKSTLLYCLAGLITPTKGEIIIDGKSLSFFSVAEIVEHRRFKIGMIFQNYNLVPNLKILDNVLLPTMFAGLTTQNVQRAMSLLERFGIAKLANRYPTELSGGQQQRVAIARALIHWPPILLADEPVGNLDSVSSKIVMDTLFELNEKDGKTIILVTHDPHYLDYAHRVFHMKDGRIIREVANPERKQIAPAKTVQLPSKISLKEEKSLTRARALVQYLLSSYDSSVIERLEKAVELRLIGKINSAQFKEILDRPFEEGGVGLYKQTAESLTQKLERVLAEIELLEQEKPEQPLFESDLDIKVQKIRQYLLDTSKVHFIKVEQVERLDEFIKLRLENKIDKRKFQELLDKPFKEGGVGLNKRTANNFAQKLELILVASQEENAS